MERSDKMYCCPEHGRVTPAETCANHGHSLATLYPRSQYRCDDCGTVHGTRPFNGAVNWQCPREFMTQPHHAPAHQTYLGNQCTRCGELVTAEMRAKMKANR